MPLFDLRGVQSQRPARWPGRHFAGDKHHALPLFRRGNRLFIAVSDPTNLAALDEIKFHTGINTDAVLIEDRVLTQAIAEWVDSQDQLGDGLSDLDSADLDDIDVSAVSGLATATKAAVMTASTRPRLSALSTRC